MHSVLFFGGMGLGVIGATWFWRQLYQKRMAESDRQWHAVLSKWQARNARRQIAEVSNG